MPALMDKEDFYYNADGFVVLTEKFHLKKGFCCGNGCLHCPYNYINVPEPERTMLLKNKKNAEKDSPR